MSEQPDHFMRSFLVTLIIALILPMTFAAPYIGALLYVWVSMMNPHRLTFGFAYTFPFALIIALACILSVAISSKRRALPNTPALWAYLLFLVWMSITSLTALNTKEAVWGQWVVCAKIHLMVLVTLMVVYEKKSLHYLIYVLVGSIGYFGAKGGIFVLLTGGSYKVWGPPESNVEENNALALGLVTLFPLLIWIYRQQTHRWLRMGLMTAMVSIIFSVLGSHSRGALLALLAMAGVLIWRSERRIVFGTILIVVIATAVAFMPDNWTNRMGTIQEHKDGSAQARLNTWRTIFNMSLDRPIMGAGFRLDNPAIYAQYSPDKTSYAFAAHSIYFQAIGEHGYPGLLLYLSIPILCIIRCRQLVKKYQNTPEAKWAVDLCKLFPVSMAGFAAGGTFLGLVHWDFTYYLVAIIMILSRMDQDGTIAAATEVVKKETKGWYSPRTDQGKSARFVNNNDSSDGRSPLTPGENRPR